jgi:hypothetical protein
VLLVVLTTNRLYTRGFIVRKYGLDDYLIALAVVSLTPSRPLLSMANVMQLLGAAQTATIVIQVQHGRGRHAADIEMRHYNHMLMVGVLCARVILVEVLMYLVQLDQRPGILPGELVVTTTKDLRVIHD